MFFQRIFSSSLLASALTGVPASHVHAGAWLAPSGQGEIIASLSFSDTTRIFGAGNRLIPVPSYRKFELGTYIEYGAADWITIVASPSLDRIQTSTASGMTQTTSGIGDTGIGGRVRIYQNGNFVFSVQGLLRPPLGLQADPSNGSYTHSRLWTGELRCLAGYSAQILGYDGFADLEMGYRWNDMAASNEWRADLTLGLHATDRILVLVQSFAAISDGRKQLTPSYYWDKGQVSSVYAFNEAWSGQLGGFLTLAGRNAGREMGPMAALWYKF